MLEHFQQCLLYKGDYYHIFIRLTKSMKNISCRILTYFFIVGILINVSCKGYFQGFNGMYEPCKRCVSEEECNEAPKQYCIWGEARDHCGRRICAKGPGERCGGPMRMLGVCGEGLMCKSDERCHGCSIITLQCYRTED